jgi:hypothetical protein
MDHNLIDNVLGQRKLIHERDASSSCSFPLFQKDFVDLVYATAPPVTPSLC